MPTTSNFGWTTPADTDLVKDGALAIRTLGNGIDTSLIDLKGGTTGQILSKASNTDLDYTWINNDVGDITNVGVTAPITGGGSSGSVTIGIDDATTAQKGAVQLEDSTSSTSTTKAATPNSVKSAYDLANGAVAKSLIDAEGDLIVGDAADAVQRLAIGSNGNVLTVDTAVDGKIKWAAPAGGGKVLQVVTATTTTFTSNATTTYSDTTLTATITPTLSTSTILVLVNQNGIAKEDGNSNSGVGLRLMRGATQISLIATRAMINFTTTGQFGTTLSTAYKDSPATTSATTYKTQFKNNAAANAAYVQIDDAMSTITLLEIGA